MFQAQSTLWNPKFSTAVHEPIPCNLTICSAQCDITLFLRTRSLKVWPGCVHLLGKSISAGRCYYKQQTYEHSAVCHLASTISLCVIILYHTDKLHAECLRTNSRIGLVSNANKFPIHLLYKQMKGTKLHTFTISY